MSNELSPIQKELLDRADSIFKSVAEAATKAANFAAEQLPDIAYQYIAMERVYLTTMFVITLGCIVLSYWCIVYGAIKDKFNLDSDSPVFIIPAFLFGFFGVAGFFLNLKPLIMVWFAPKIYLITNIVSLIKS